MYTGGMGGRRIYQVGMEEAYISGWVGREGGYPCIPTRVGREAIHHPGYVHPCIALGTPPGIHCSLLSWSYDEGCGAAQNDEALGSNL